MQFGINVILHLLAVHMSVVLISFQVRILAEDNGVNKRTATVMLFVTINRNFQRPIFPFNQQFVTVTIPEDLSGVPFVTITAEDTDRQPPNNVVNYQYRAGDNSDDADYFQINATSGAISVFKDLRYDPRASLAVNEIQQDYVVCICSVIKLQGPVVQN